MAKKKTTQKKIEKVVETPSPETSKFSLVPKDEGDCFVSLKDQLGFMPDSVWDITKDPRWTKMIKDWGDPTGKKRQEANSSQKMAIKFSEFNPSVAERIFKLWSEVGDFVVDPFGGRATRAVVSGVLGRRYRGFEIAPQTYDLTKNRIDKVNAIITAGLVNSGSEDQAWVYPNIILGDGVKMEGVEDHSADLIMTCPPYWDVEKYESVDGQLSDCSEYDEFIRFIARCLLRCKQILKPEKFMVWVVADMRRNGRIIPFHYDLVRIALKLGFSLHDEVIMRNRSPFARFVSTAIKNHHTVKIHEYILVFKSPKA